MIANSILFSNLSGCGPELNSTSLPASSAPQTSSASIQACAASTTMTSSPQATGSLESNNSCSCTPISDCASMGSTWASELVNNVQFDIYCDTHYSGGDIASFYAYQFEDCINACATYNTYILAHTSSNCSGVTYAAAEQQPANCFLKDSTAEQTTEPGADSAVLLPS